jgi:predicted molibdopterin-dependent oxidoreductase YjgC
VNPADANQIGIDSGDRVTVSTRRGSLIATAFVVSTVARGSIFLPMHYPEVNRLTIAAFDPHSGQPSYKACAAKLEVRARQDAREDQKSHAKGAPKESHAKAQRSRESKGVESGIR